MQNCPGPELEPHAGLSLAALRCVFVLTVMVCGRRRHRRIPREEQRDPLWCAGGGTPNAQGLRVQRAVDFQHGRGRGGWRAVSGAVGLAPPPHPPILSGVRPLFIAGVCVGSGALTLVCGSGRPCPWMACCRDDRIWGYTSWIGDPERWATDVRRSAVLMDLGDVWDGLFNHIVRPLV